MKLVAAFSLLMSASMAGAQSTVHPTPILDNSEMTQLFEADQSVRKNITPDKVEDRAYMAGVIKGDAARRDRTEQLLNEEKLVTANDYYHAAFVFQHGGKPTDYLVAHSLALASAALGNRHAAWIAAATLDRYLMAIGQKQIYGTQYRKTAEAGWTMEPYDREIVPDALRRALEVPSLAKQEERLNIVKSNKSTSR